MGSEKFCLRWNDFESNISVAFRELRDDKDFFDVTLACDDEQIQAHKVILSACSPFFRNVLRRNHHQHPLLYLKGVKFTDLQSVLNFMYHGEVNVAQEELNSFLAVAEDLRVKGLTQNDQPGSKRISNHSYLKSERDAGTAPPSKRPRASSPPSAPAVKQPLPPPPPSQLDQEDEDIQEISPPIKNEPRDLAGGVLCQQEQEGLVYQDPEDHEAEYEDYTQYEGGGAGGGQFGVNHDPGTQVANRGRMRPGVTPNPVVEGVTSPDDLYSFCLKEVGESKWKCSICFQFTHNGRNQVRNHVESKHFPNVFEYSCQHCGNVCSTKKALDVHISTKHRANQAGYPHEFK